MFLSEFSLYSSHFTQAALAAFPGVGGHERKRDTERSLRVSKPPVKVPPQPPAEKERSSAPLLPRASRPLGTKDGVFPVLEKMG